jgi:prepilin-type N-terminal cleavage/methylation domain-containing protein
MRTNLERRGGQRGSGVRGFTLFELLISVAVIAVLISLVVLGARAAQRAAGAVVDQTGVDQAYEGVRKFREELGFMPPLVREYESRGAVGVDVPQVQLSAGVETRVDLDWTAVIVQDASTGRNRIAVYRRSANDDAEFLRGEGGLYVGPVNDNSLQDNRYSELSLGYFVSSQLEAPYGPTFAAGANFLPMDGIVGPGMYAPTREGDFDVPAEKLAANVSDRRSVGREFGPYVEVGEKALRAVIDVDSATGVNAGRDVTLRDRNNIPMRYYRWLPNPIAGQQPSDDQLALPPLVGRLSTTTEVNVPNERNPAINTSLRSARWAIIAAGPDRAFGDEPLEYVARALGETLPDASDTQPIRRLRLKAARDNIVRVGTEEN